MSSRTAKGYLAFAICATVACILGIIGTMRYIGRLPDDTLGVVLYIAASMLYAVLATICYIRWVHNRK